MLLGREDGADVERTEGARAKGAKRIKSRNDCVRVLKDEAAGGRESEHGAERTVEGFDLDPAGAWEGLRGFECESQWSGER